MESRVLYPCMVTCLALVWYDWLACTVLASLALIDVCFLSTEQCFYESVGYGSYSIYMYTTLMIEYTWFIVYQIELTGDAPQVARSQELADAPWTWSMDHGTEHALPCRRCREVCCSALMCTVSRDFGHRRCTGSHGETCVGVAFFPLPPYFRRRKLLQLSVAIFVQIDRYDSFVDFSAPCMCALLDLISKYQQRTNMHICTE